MQKVNIKFVKNYLTKRLIYDFTLDDECSEVEREILNLIHTHYNDIFKYLREFDVCKLETLKIHPFYIMADSSVGLTDDKEYHRILKEISISIAGEVNNYFKGGVNGQE